MGYLNNMEKTKEAIDDEGWLHSGDVGKVDEVSCPRIFGNLIFPIILISMMLLKIPEIVGGQHCKYWPSRFFCLRICPNLLWALSSHWNKVERFYGADIQNFKLAFVYRCVHLCI